VECSLTRRHNASTDTYFEVAMMETSNWMEPVGTFHLTSDDIHEPAEYLIMLKKMTKVSGALDDIRTVRELKLFLISWSRWPG